MGRRPAGHAQTGGSRPGRRGYSPPAPRELPVLRQKVGRSAVCPSPTFWRNTSAARVSGAHQRPRSSCLPIAGPPAAPYQLRGGLGSEASEAGFERRLGFHRGHLADRPPLNMISAARRPPVTTMPPPAVMLFASGRPVSWTPPFVAR